MTTEFIKGMEDSCLKQIQMYESWIEGKRSFKTCHLCNTPGLSGPSCKGCVLDDGSGKGACTGQKKYSSHCIDSAILYERGQRQKRLKYLLKIFNKRFKGKWTFHSSIDLSKTKI